MAGIKRERVSRSRSPIRRANGNDRRTGGRDRNKPSFNQHSDRMVYFSNLPYEMSWMELKDIVRERAGEVNFIETIDGRDGRPTGCAIVEFKSKDSASKCIEIMHRQEVRGRNIITKEIRDPVNFFRKIREDTGVDFLGNRDRQSSLSNRNLPRRASPTINDNETYGLSPAFLNQLNVKLPLVDRVFITNISFGCGVGKLFDVCSLAGKVVWFDLQLDAEGKSKGMAIVQYSHPIEAVQAISMLNGQRIYDRSITVKMDRYEKKEDRRDGELPAGLRGIGMGLGANGAPLADVASVISSISSTNASTPAAIQHAQPLSLLNAQITNPFGTNSVLSGANSALNPTSHALLQLQQQQMLQPFSGGASDITASSLLGAHSFGGGNGTMSGNSGLYGNSTKPGYFTSNSSSGGSGALVPSSAPSSLFKTSSSGVNGAMFNGPASLMGSGRGTSSDVGGHFGSNVTYEPSRIILIKNLPMDYTWQIVSDRVQQFGDLESVEMVSPGVAKVRFLQVVDAERAKQTLQGTTVEGRVIGIEYL